MNHIFMRNFLIHDLSSILFKDASNLPLYYEVCTKFCRE